MTTAMATTIDPAVIERVLIHGDLRQLSSAQKVSYYKAVCESVGLNPLTQPFQYLVLNGREILYALRSATEQLRQIHSVSIEITGREVMEDCYIVTARATLPSGRTDENIGAVPIANLKGENRANAMMKAETKAKRRVTLAICGLGLLDETEVDSIDDSQKRVPDPPLTILDTATGEEVPASEKRTAPEGYAYIHSIDRSNEWYVVHIARKSGNGTVRYSTKFEPIGVKAEQAYQDGIPVQIVPGKKKGDGDFYLNDLHLWKPEPTDAEIDAEIARKELAKQAGDVA